MNKAVANKIMNPRILPSQPVHVILGSSRDLTPPQPAVHSPTLLQPSRDWDANATSHFLYHYTLEATNDLPSHLGFLPELLSKTSKNSHLQSAILAAGYASLANLTSISHIRVTSARHYTRALGEISTGLMNNNETGSDALLASIVIIQICEVSVSLPLHHAYIRLLIKHQQIINGSSDESHDLHEEGISAVLRTRGDAIFSTPIGQELFRTIQNKRQIRDLAGNSSVATEASYEVGQVTQQPTRADLCGLLREASQSCAKVRLLLNSSAEINYENDLIKIVAKVRSVYESLLAWQKAVPPQWMYHVYRFPRQAIGSFDQPDFPTNCYTFKRKQFCGLWLSAWCAQIHLLQALDALLVFPITEELLTCNPWPEWETCSRLSSVIDDICASIPYMMDDVSQSGALNIAPGGTTLGAFFLIRALYVASSVRTINAVQQNYISRTLTRIGYAKGIRAALKLASNN